MRQKPIEVLLIEDDADDAELIRRFLSSPDEGPAFELRAADRLGAGCRLLSQESFDVVLLDLVLPCGVGIEAFLKVRESKPAVPVVVLTGLKDEGLALEAVALGAQDYLVKGTIDARLVKRSIRYAIERARLLARVEQLLAKDPDGKLVVDSQGVVRYANPAAQDLLGGRQSLVGRPLEQPVPVEGALELSLAARVRAPQRVVELRAAALEWDGQPARLVSVRDITDLRLADKLRAEAREHLADVDLKTEFVTSISHELRNPLTTVKTAIQSLRDGLVGPLTAQQRRFVELAHRNVERQVRIINNVLDLARLQSGHSKLEWRPIGAAALIEDLLQSYSIQPRKQKLEAALSSELPEIRADLDLLTQVLTNLIDNALRYAASRVVLRAEPAVIGEDRRAAVQLSVIDDGPGMSAQQSEQLFSRFVQVTRTAGAGSYKGTGLGLALCKEIVSAHGGRIWVETAPGKGARFHTVWPAEPAFTQASLPAPSKRGDNVFTAPQ